MKKPEQAIMLCTAVLCVGLMFGILIGRFGTNHAVTLSAYDRLAADMPTQTAPYRNETAGKININTASAEELAMLPEIGITSAERIVAHRLKYGPFLSIKELTNIKGISEKRLEAIKDYITVGG